MYEYQNVSRQWDTQSGHMISNTYVGQCPTQTQKSPPPPAPGVVEPTAGAGRSDHAGRVAGAEARSR